MKSLVVVVATAGKGVFITVRKIMKSKLFWLVLLIGFIDLNNSSLFIEPSGRPTLIAHRGLGQTFSMDGVTSDTNTAARIYPPEHMFIENTIPSMEAAFAAGADVVELDIHPTTDGDFAVFHDWILEYRTNGSGPVRDYPMSYLKTLDVGYGYTANGGKTYPLRGLGVGLMPTLEEVLNRFPDKRFLIHIKSNDQQEGILLAQYLSRFEPNQLELLTVYGGNEPIAALKEIMPDIKVMSKATMLPALAQYMLVGWTGWVPPAMRDAHFHIPLRYARFLWGWPHRLVQRLDRVGSTLVVVRGDGSWSEGFDSPEHLRDLPIGFSGGIWTNRIDRIGKILGISDTFHN